MHISNLLNTSNEELQPDSETPVSSSIPSSPRNTSDDDLEPTQLNIVPAVFAQAAITRKRALDEDLSQYADTISKKHRLKHAVEKELHMFAKMYPEKQMIWLAGQLLNTAENVKQISVTEAGNYQIPTSLASRIDRYAFVAIVSPTAASYVKKDELLDRVVDHLAKHPKWGLTPEVKDDKAKLDIIKSKIGTRLTQRRYEIKNLIKASLGQVNAEGKLTGAQDIVELGTDILNLGKRLYNIKLTIQLCGRFAALRNCYVELAEKDSRVKDYWQYVDAKLEEIRTKKTTPEAVSRFFSALLDCDRNKFGTPNMNEVMLNVEVDPFGDDN